MTLRRILLSIWVLVALCLGPLASAQDSPAEEADRFMTMLRQGQFFEGAKAFHYPAAYTPSQLSEDRAGVARFLEGLAQDIGEIEMARRAQKPDGTYFDLGIGGGDAPYWASHPR